MVTVEYVPIVFAFLVFLVVLIPSVGLLFCRLCCSIIQSHLLSILFFVFNSASTVSVPQVIAHVQIQSLKTPITQ